MANDDDLLAAAGVFGGLALLGLGAVAYQNYAKRQAFEAKLRSGLHGFGVELVSFGLGWLNDSEPVWNLTILHPGAGVQALQSRYLASVDPYALSTADDLIERVRWWLVQRVA